MILSRHHPSSTMHFLFYSSLSLSLSHRCFVIVALNCLRLAYLAFTVASPLLCPGFLEPALPMKPNIRFLVAARLYRHGRSPSYNVPPFHVLCTYHFYRSPLSLTHVHLAFRALHSAVFIYSSRSTCVKLPACYPRFGATMKGPRAARLLSTIVMYIVRYRRALVFQYTSAFDQIRWLFLEDFCRGSQSGG